MLILAESCAPAIRTIPGAGANLGMAATCIRAQFVNRATPCAEIEIAACATGVLGERKEGLFMVEMRNRALLHQAFGNQFWLIIELKLADQPQPQ